MHKAIIENKSAVTLHGVKPGGKIRIDVDRNGTPLDRNWRRRVADAPIDDAVKITFEETQNDKTEV